MGLFRGGGEVCPYVPRDRATRSALRCSPRRPAKTVLINALPAAPIVARPPRPSFCSFRDGHPRRVGRRRPPRHLCADRLEPPLNPTQANAPAQPEYGNWHSDCMSRPGSADSCCLTRGCAGLLRSGGRAHHRAVLGQLALADELVDSPVQPGRVDGQLLRDVGNG